MLRIFLALLIGLTAAGCGNTRKKEDRVDQVIDFYRQNNAPAHQCYKDALTQDPGVAGKLALVWRVDHSGKPQAARIAKSEVANKFLEDCVLNHLRGLQFPPQPRFSPAQVEYEFNFQRGG